MIRFGIMWRIIQQIKISKEAFWALVKFKYPTHQIVFCTEEALQTLHYEGSITL